MAHKTKLDRAIAIVAHNHKITHDDMFIPDNRELWIKVAKLKRLKTVELIEMMQDLNLYIY
jgi:hypothetical protein